MVTIGELVVIFDEHDPKRIDVARLDDEGHISHLCGKEYRPLIANPIGYFKPEWVNPQERMPKEGEEVIVLESTGNPYSPYSTHYRKPVMRWSKLHMRMELQFEWDDVVRWAYPPIPDAIIPCADR